MSIRTHYNVPINFTEISLSSPGTARRAWPDRDSFSEVTQWGWIVAQHPVWNYVGIRKGNLYQFRIDLVSTHYGDVIMGAMASQITSLTIVYSTVYSGGDQRKHHSSASLAFMRGIHRWPVNSPHKWPATWKMFPFDDVIMHRFWQNCVVAICVWMSLAFGAGDCWDSRYHLRVNKALNTITCN